MALIEHHILIIALTLSQEDLIYSSSYRAHIPSQIHPKHPYHPPTNAPTPEIDAMMSGCVAYDAGDATHPDMSAVDAGFDPVIQH